MSERSLEDLAKPVPLRELESSAPVSDLYVVCPPEESMTRQEFYHDSLVSTILQRSGVPAGHAFRSGEVDYDVDLTRAYEADAAMREAFAALPASARRFGSFQALGEALARGLITRAEVGLSSAEGDPGPAASDSAPVSPPPVSS